MNANIPSPVNINYTQYLGIEVKINTCTHLCTLSNSMCLSCGHSVYTRSIKPVWTRFWRMLPVLPPAGSFLVLFGTLVYRAGSTNHGCRWEAFYIFAYCGLVGNPHLTAKI